MSTLRSKRRQRFKPRPASQPREMYGEDVIRPEIQSLGGKTCVAIHYEYAEPYGEAKAWFTFEVGTFFRLATGGVCRVECLSAGEALQMENGGFCIVTQVGNPQVVPKSRNFPGEDGLKQCQVIGGVKHTGNVVIDIRASGGHLSTTTPDHPYWSETRRGWVPAGRLRVGEEISGIAQGAIHVESISSPRFGYIELYNLEVDDAHTFYVGNPPVLVHNGICIEKPLRGAELEDWMAAGRLSTKTIRGVGAAELDDLHHIATIYPGKRDWSTQFDRIFKRAGFHLEDDINKIRVPGHFGGHPDAYHRTVLQSLQTATKGLKGEAYRNAFIEQMNILRQRVVDPKDFLNALITR